MIVSLRVDNCGGCGRAVVYQRAADVPLGLVFVCVNQACAYYGQMHMLPTVKALRYYPAPQEDAA